MDIYTATATGGTALGGDDSALQEDIQIALALSLSEADASSPRPNINPNSRSAVAIAKEEERQVREAIQQSLAEESKPSSVLDREPLPPAAITTRRQSRAEGVSAGLSYNHRSFARGGISPFLRSDVNPNDLPELV